MQSILEYGTLVLRNLKGAKHMVGIGVYVTIGIVIYGILSLVIVDLNSEK